MTARTTIARRRGGISRLAIPFACLALLVTGFPGAAAKPTSATLSSASQVVRWTGSESGPGYTPPAYTPQTCRLAARAHLCDVFLLDVQLPVGTFQKPGDGVFVDVRWATDFDQWNLFVFAPNGSLVASGFDLDSNAQALLIKHPANGVYSLVIVPFYMDQKMSYRGEARVFLDDTERYASPALLLPQLQTMPAYDFHVACGSVDPTSTNTNGGCVDVPPTPSNPTGWRWGGGFANSCYLNETLLPFRTDTSKRPRRCLRFSNDIHNVGAGPLRLRLSLRDALGGIVGGPCEMSQVIDRTNGNDLVRQAGPCIFHRAHAHFHYQGFASYALYAAPAANAITPPDMSRPPVARAAKVGYCLIDVDFWGSLDHPTTIWPRQNSFPNCNVPTQGSVSTSSFQEMGISRGWGDIYTWDLPGQFIDTTNVPDGAYDVVSIANPLCQLAEAATGKEMAVTRIRLQGDTVRVLGSFGPYPVPGCIPPTA